MQRTRGIQRTRGMQRPRGVPRPRGAAATPARRWGRGGAVRQRTRCAERRALRVQPRDPYYSLYLRLMVRGGTASLVSSDGPGRSVYTLSLRRQHETDERAEFRLSAAAHCAAPRSSLQRRTSYPTRHGRRTPRGTGGCTRLSIESRLCVPFQPPTTYLRSQPRLPGISTTARTVTGNSHYGSKGYREFPLRLERYSVGSPRYVSADPAARHRRTGATSGPALARPGVHAARVLYTRCADPTPASL